MALVKKFCFCLSLQLGTVLIGCLGILQGIVYTVIILMNFSSRFWPAGIEEPYNIDYLRVLLAIAQLVCSVQLVISVECQRSACTLPWLVVNFCDLVDRLAFLLSVTFGGKHTVEVDVREVALGIMFMLLIFEIWFYCWLSVLCFYLELRKVVHKSELDAYPIDLDHIDADMYLV